MLEKFRLALPVPDLSVFSFRTAGVHRLACCVPALETFPSQQCQQIKGTCCMPYALSMLSMNRNGGLPAFLCT